MKIFFVFFVTLLHCFAYSQVDSTTLIFLTDIIKRKDDTSIIYYADSVHKGMYEFYAKKGIKSRVQDIDSRNKAAINLSKKEISFLKGKLKNKVVY